MAYDEVITLLTATRWRETQFPGEFKNGPGLRPVACMAVIGGVIETRFKVGVIRIS